MKFVFDNEIQFASIIKIFILWIPKLLAAFFILVFFWLLSIILVKIILRALEKIRLDASLQYLLVRSLRVLVLLLAVITAGGTLGIDITGIVAGLGLTGFAIGFALKDIISNLVSGVLLLLYHPFRIGDQIQVSGCKGKVISIDLRYTELLQGEKKILLPNAKLFSEIVTVEKPGRK